MYKENKKVKHESKKKTIDKIGIVPAEYDYTNKFATKMPSRLAFLADLKQLGTLNIEFS